MIKNIKLGNVLFFALMLATIAVSIYILVFWENPDLSPMFTSGKPDMPVLVIDPGHGGEDGGAVSISGVHESVLNLDIALKMAALSDLTGVNYVITRDSEEIAYPESAKSVSSRKKYDQKRRAELILNTSNAVLISIHQNCYPHKSPHGPQSFYAKTESSDTLSELVQNSMNVALCPGNRRISMPVAKNIFLFKNVACPAVLVECGFISNPTESKLLETEAYRLKIAAVLTSAYLQYLDTNE